MLCQKLLRTAVSKTANKTKIIWSCRECGHAQAKWTGSCSACQNWNTLIEEVSVSRRKAVRSEKAGDCESRSDQRSQRRFVQTRLHERWANSTVFSGAALSKVL